LIAWLVARRLLIRGLRAHLWLPSKQVLLILDRLPRSTRRDLRDEQT